MTTTTAPGSVPDFRAGIDVAGDSSRAANRRTPSVVFSKTDRAAITHRRAPIELRVADCSEITRVEVIRGLPSAERVPAERLFHQLRWVALDEPIARRAGEFGRKWRKSHPGISSPDLVVAATAEQLGADLATSNIRHFPMFKRLQPSYQG
ncbi:MAG: PIN domain-containing protein [Actinomycetota bacterium]|nr:PIN domain-containing protein [Actinomycetota bacterium]